MKKFNIKELKNLNNNTWVRIVLFIIISFIYALNIRVLIKPGNLLPGGIAGLTLLTQSIFSKFLGFEPSYTLINVFLNLIPIYIGFRFIGVKFTLYSCIIVIGSSIFTDMIPTIPTFSNDVILYSIFGGVVNGLLATLCLISGGTTGGTDFISIYFAEKKGRDVWDYILIFNAFVLLTAGAIFGIQRALYSIIFQFVSTQTIKIMYHKYQQSTLLIITTKPNEVYDEIKKISNHGATLFKGKGCYKGENVEMIYSVVDNDLVNKISKDIRVIDSSSFIDVIKTEQINGKFYRKPTE